MWLFRGLADRGAHPKVGSDLLWSLAILPDGYAYFWLPIMWLNRDSTGLSRSPSLRVKQRRGTVGHEEMTPYEMAGKPRERTVIPDHSRILTSFVVELPIRE